ELVNVSFSYNDAEILRNINLSINKNETVAIIGESGSGKTTLINLLSGLLYPSKGQLIIDGVPIKDLEQYSFKQKIGYIAQEAPTFNDTIFNNVTFWSEKTVENQKKFEKA